MENLVPKQILKEQKKLHWYHNLSDKKDICYFSLLSYFLLGLQNVHFSGWRMETDVEIPTEFLTIF